LLYPTETHRNKSSFDPKANRPKAIINILKQNTMRNFTVYLALLACIFASRMTAQETFEEKAKTIATKIDAITKDEKALLKAEVEEVNKKLEGNSITPQEAEAQKKEFAEMRARNIETRVAEAEKELSQLVQDRVDGKIKDNDSVRRFKFTWKWNEWEKDSKKRDSIRQRRSESRTTSQFVFATGVNNLVTDGAVANSDFRYLGSHFYEWGISYNYRLAKNNNLLHLKYGLSLMYNNLRATENRMFVDNGTTTELVENPVHMRDSRFRNVNLVVPMHLEFDFTKKREYDGKTVFKTHESFRFGIGGFAGVNVKSKQIIKYDIDGYKTREITKGNFNVNDFVYGVSSYIGYGETSLYLKYDLNPLFRNNAVDQNNISLGVRFDLN
jgi:hypothetical protein